MYLSALLFLTLGLILSNAAEAENPKNDMVEHQDLDLAPPFPILEIGLQHILGQIGENSSKAENESIIQVPGFQGLRPRPSLKPAPTSITMPLNQKVGSAQCSATMPCLE